VFTVSIGGVVRRFVPMVMVKRGDNKMHLVFLKY
jgi:hypothetical protein